MKLGVKQWVQSGDPFWMAQAVPNRPKRTADAFRFVTAAVLRKAPKVLGAWANFCPDLADSLDEAPAAWQPEHWRQFYWWCRQAKLPGDSLVGIDHRTFLIQSSARGPNGFARFMEMLHFGVNFYEGSADDRDADHGYLDELAANAIREVFGVPLSPLYATKGPRKYKWPPRALPGVWVTDTVRGVAQQMWDTRNFDAMPILADALQDAGCDRVDVLAHCRDPKQEHSRGCWVLDAIRAGG